LCISQNIESGVILLLLPQGEGWDEGDLNKLFPYFDFLSPNPLLLERALRRFTNFGLYKSLTMNNTKLDLSPT
jgi:hypothetical protein